MNAPLEAGVAPFVLSRVDGGVCYLTLNRGERYNALSRDMIAALRSELQRIAANPALRCVVLGAEGRGFCAGHDLKELRAHPDLAWQQQLFAECNALMVSLTTLPQPVIARVHGIATAAGCQLVAMCDLAVAADTARFALPGVNVGVFCTTPAVGVGRKAMSDDDYRAFARDGTTRSSRRPLDEAAWQTFAPALFYQGRTLDDPAAFRSLGHCLTPDLIALNWDR